MTAPPDTFEFEVIASTRSGLVAQAEKMAAEFFGDDDPITIQCGTARMYMQTAAGAALSYRADCTAHVGGESE